MEKEKIARINALAHKAKTSGLTEAELAERDALRQEYLADIRASMIDQLEHTLSFRDLVNFTDFTETRLARGCVVCTKLCRGIGICKRVCYNIAGGESRLQEISQPPGRLNGKGCTFCQSEVIFHAYCNYRYQLGRRGQGSYGGPALPRL